MKPIQEIASVIRSKNCSPFELTLDIIFKDAAVYNEIKERELINKAVIADAYKIPVEQIHKVIYFDPAHAVKITLARQVSSGSPGDSDVYGAQQHGPLLTLRFDL